MKVQVKKTCKGFLLGGRFHAHADGPIEVDNIKAQELIKAGLVEPCVQMPTVEKAVNPKTQAATR